MRRFTSNERYAYPGAKPIPSGEPFIDTVKLPLPDGSDGFDIQVDVIIACRDTFDGIGVSVHGHCPYEHGMMICGEEKKPGENWVLSWDFPCERDALAFASIIRGGVISLQALEELTPNRAPKDPLLEAKLLYADTRTEMDAVYDDPDTSKWDRAHEKHSLARWAFRLAVKNQVTA